MTTNLRQRGLVLHDILVRSHKNVELSTLQNWLCVAAHVWRAFVCNFDDRWSPFVKLHHPV